MIQATIEFKAVIIQGTENAIHAYPTTINMLFDPLHWNKDDLQASINDRIERTIFVMEGDDVAVSTEHIDDGLFDTYERRDVTAPDYTLPCSSYYVETVPRKMNTGRPCVLCSVESVLEDMLMNAAQSDAVPVPEIALSLSESPQPQFANQHVTLVKITGVDIEVMPAYTDRTLPTGSNSTYYYSEVETGSVYLRDSQVTRIPQYEDDIPHLHKLLARHSLVIDSVLYFTEAQGDEINDEDHTD